MIFFFYVFQEDEWESGVILSFSMKFKEVCVGGWVMVDEVPISSGIRVISESGVT